MKPEHNDVKVFDNGIKFTGKSKLRIEDFETRQEVEEVILRGERRLLRLAFFILSIIYMTLAIVGLGEKWFSIAILIAIVTLAVGIIVRKFTKK